ncbi:MAG: xylulokinase [Pseudomonadota bacterium]
MTSVLGIDVGTQSVKAVVYNAEKRAVVAVTSAPLELRQDVSGLAEQDAAAWISALHLTLDQLDVALRREIGALSVSGQQHGFVALNAAGDVLCPVKLWCDTTSVDACRQITASAGGDEVCIANVGNRMLPGYTAGKIHQMRTSAPALFDALDTVLLPHDYINFYLTGERTMEAGDASGTGLFDVRNLEWSESQIRAVDPSGSLAAKLPAVRVSNEAIGNLRADVAKTMRLPPGIPVAIGGGDNMMAAIGTTNVVPGRMTISLGTSGTVFAYSSEPVVDPRGEIAAFCSSTGGWLPLLCTMNCTVATDLVRRFLVTEIGALDAALDMSCAGADGVTTVPFFSGERTPNLPTSRGAFFGISPDNLTPQNLLRATVEGVTFALRAGADRLAQLSRGWTQIVVTGGGANSPVWRQMIADIFNAPVVRPVCEEGAAFGAALQALQLLSDGQSIEHIVNEHCRLNSTHAATPTADAVTDYHTFFTQYERAAAAVGALYDDTAAIAQDQIS